MRLKEHCTVAESGSLPPWIRRLFSKSALLYGNLDPSQNVIIFRSPEPSLLPPSESEQKPPPFWTRNRTSPMLPHLPELKQASEISMLLCASNTDRRTPSVLTGEVDILSAADGPSSILSIECETVGIVRSIFGPKLPSWSNTSLAYQIIRAWLCGMNTRKDRNTMSDLAVARALVGDTRGSDSTTSMPDHPRGNNPIRRLQPRDHEGLSN